MNHQTTYEKIIAGKLGQLPVPGMREAIWSRIEEQLDADPPSDDNGPGNDPPAPRPFPVRGAGILVVSALILIFFINKKTSQPNINNGRSPLPATQIKAPASNDNNNNSPPPQTDNNTPSPVHHDNTAVNPADTVVQYPFVQPRQNALTIDTPARRTVQPPPLPHFPAPAIRQDTVAKKSRGFKGITDDDYRISLKKDSVP